MAPDGHVVRIGQPTRSLDQNALMWPLLDAFSEQLRWPVNGEMTELTATEFKDIFTAGFKKELARLAMGVDGGVVMLGHRTSTMTKQTFSEWIEFLHYIAAIKGVEINHGR